MQSVCPFVHSCIHPFVHFSKIFTSKSQLNQNQNPFRHFTCDRPVEVLPSQIPVSNLSDPVIRVDSHLDTIFIMFTFEQTKSVQRKLVFQFGTRVHHFCLELKTKAHQTAGQTQTQSLDPNTLTTPFSPYVRSIFCCICSNWKHKQKTVGIFFKAVPYW